MVEISEALRDDGGQRATDHVATALPEHLLGPCVPEQDTALRIDGDDRVVGRMEDGLETALRVLEGTDEAGLLAHVADDAREEPLAVRDPRGQGQLHRNLGAVFPAPRDLDRLAHDSGLARRDDPAQAFVMPVVEAFRDDEREGLPYRLGLDPTEDALRRRVPGDDGALGVCGDDRVARGPDDGIETLCGIGHPLSVIA